MLACRLCLEFGEQDPEQWLENCPPRVLNVWKAFSIADKWPEQRRLSASHSIVSKRLLAMKYHKDDRQAALESVDDTAELYMPIDWQIEKDEAPKQMSDGVLQVMSRGGEVIKTPLHTTEIEFDPWQRR